MFIVGSDFNPVWDPAVDRSGASETPDQRQASAALQSWARVTGLVDSVAHGQPLSERFFLLFFKT